MQEVLTDRQQQVLDYINHSINRRGYPPTLREIGQHLHIRSTNGVNDHLKALERKGFLRREDLKSRSLRPTQNSGIARVPLLGSVAAGQPILAVENADETIQVDTSLVGENDNVFALRIKGESMIEAGIFDGDIVFVKQQSTASKGDTVVAMIEGEATVKYYYPEGGRIRFQPANESMEPIYVDETNCHEDSVSLLGVVVGVFRKV